MSEKPAEAGTQPEGLLGQLSTRQRRYPDVGSADSTRDSWIAAGKRDAAALLLSTPHSRLLLGADLGSSPAEVKLRLLEEIIDPLATKHI
jgi:hypothetical protein